MLLFGSRVPHDQNTVLMKRFSDELAQIFYALTILILSNVLLEINNGHILDAFEGFLLWLNVHFVVLVKLISKFNVLFDKIKLCYARVD